MPGVTDLYPPVAHHDVWWILGLIALVAAIAVVVWAWWPSSPSRRRRRVADGGPVDVDDLKQRTLDTLDELERSFERRLISERELHHELSAVLRRFAAALGPVPAHSMTPVELFEAGLPDLANVLHSYYPPRFKAWSPSIPAEAIDAARTVVSQW